MLKSTLVDRVQTTEHLLHIEKREHMLWSMISEFLINILIDLLVGVFVELALAAFSSIYTMICMQSQPPHINFAL